jgi:hypothetical protein
VKPPLASILVSVLCTSTSQEKVQTDGISSHDTSSVTAEPFHVLHMDPMSDVSMCNQVLVAHLCHPMLEVWQV